MHILALDHLVLTVADIDRTVAFYCTQLGMEHHVSREGRVSLHFGSQKINLHQAGAEFEPKALRPCPGSADLCFILDPPAGRLVAELESRGIAVLEGPVQRVGAAGPMESVYIRDPDGNLVELARYLPDQD